MGDHDDAHLRLIGRWLKGGGGSRRPSRSARFRELLARPVEDELVTEAVRDAREYLADVESGQRPPLPIGGS